MRRTIFLGLGLLELSVAVLLVVIGLKLPGGAEVRQGFNHVEGLTGEAGKQVVLLRDSQDHVLSSVAQGMEAWANALDPTMIRQLRQGTAELAAFLQDDVAPAASRSAGRLEKAIDTFQKDALLLSQILKDTPPDLKAAKEIHESLGKFGEGIDKVSLMISEERLKTMREGFKGMEGSLETGAEQIDRLAGFTYPVIKFNGLKPEIDEKSFWPDGEDIAKGMRKGAKAMRKAGKELDTQAANLPLIQRSLNESRKAVGRVRDMLGDAVKNQDKVEKVLASLPRNTAQLADDLPLLAKDLNRILRETERLKDISAGLKQAETLLASAEKSWPEARKGLLDSAAQLRAMKKNDQGQQAQSLDALGSNLQEIHAAIPGTSQSVVEILTLVRWLLWVVAAAVTLHGAYLLLSVRLQQPLFQPEAQARD